MPGTYKCRWAPYVKTHEPKQGQLPSGSIRPRALFSVTRRAAPLAAYVGWTARQFQRNRQDGDVWALFWGLSAPRKGRATAGNAETLLIDPSLYLVKDFR